MDSRVWNDFEFRDDDIVIATYAKSGTTWMQQIVAQLVFAGATDIDVHTLSPWLDNRFRLDEKLQFLGAQTHRRFIKTHLPVDALVFSPEARYLYIGRDGRDVLWSLHNHHFHHTDSQLAIINNPDGLVGPPLAPADPDVRAYFLDWLEHDGHPYWPFFEHVRGWWEARHLPNVRLVHFDDLKRDLEGGIRGIADFLSIDVPRASWPRIVEHCTFDYMKTHAQRFAPRGGIAWEGGADRFIHKGTNGRWRDVLSAADCSRYQAMAVEQLGVDCASWLATGGQSAPGRSASSG